MRLVPGMHQFASRCHRELTAACCRMRNSRRKDQSCHRPRPVRAVVEEHLTAVILHDLLHNRESQSGSLRFMPVT